MQRWKSNPIPCYVHSPQKSYASSSSADYRGAICQSLLSDRSILSNAPCRLSDNRAVLTVCHDSCLNRGPIRRRFQVWLMSLYPFYLFTNWKFLQWRLILAWQTLELEKDLKGPIWTPWIVLDRLGSSWSIFGPIVGQCHHCRSFASMSSKMSHFPCGEPQTCGSLDRRIHHEVEAFQKR